MQWGSKATSMQMIPSSSTVIMALLKKHDEKELRKIAHDNAKEHFSENLLLLKNEESVDAWRRDTFDGQVDGPYDGHGRP